MDKRRGILNISVSIGFKLLLLIGALLERRFLIQYIGNDVNGLHSLYISIIGVLAMADLGLGSAISFCMYKPIVDGQNDIVAALYGLFKKFNLVVGAIIFALGLGIMPFLQYLAKDYREIDVNLYSTFFLMLISVVLTYGYSAKTSLINAYKNDYVTTTITSSGSLLQYALQIVVIVIWRSFELHLLCRTVVVLLQWLATNLYTKKNHREILSRKEKLPTEAKKDLFKIFKATCMHKFGTVMVNTIDSIIISSFIGLTVLGKYSNYTTIITAMMGVISLFFVPITSVIGHMYVHESKENVVKYYDFFYGFNYVIGVFFFCVYFAGIDPLITLVFGSQLDLDLTVVYVITLNYFIQFMRNATSLFRNATGTFYNDRWKPLYESISNLLLSLILVHYLGLAGILIATIITNLLICHTVEPHVIYKYAFGMSVKKQLVKNYLYIALFALVLWVLYYCKVSLQNAFANLIVNSLIGVAVSIVPCAVLYFTNQQFRLRTTEFIKKLSAKLIKRRS